MNKILIPGISVSVWMTPIELKAPEAHVKDFNIHSLPLLPRAEKQPQGDNVMYGLHYTIQTDKFSTALNLSLSLWRSLFQSCPR